MHFGLSASNPNASRFELDNGQTKLIFRGGYAPSFLDELKSGGFDIVVISTGHWEDLGWLAEAGVPIPRLEIVSACESYCGLERISGLFELSVDDRLDGVELSSFSNLTSLSLFWSKSIKGKISSLKKLESLTVSYYGEKNLVEFQNLSNLKSLDLRMGSIKSLAGVDSCTQLSHFELAYLRSLEDVNAIENLRNLKIITIEKCPKVTNIDFLKNLSYLEKIHVECGCESIDGIELFLGMARLKRLLIGVQAKEVAWEKLFTLPCLEEVLIDIPAGDLPDEEYIQQVCRKVGREVFEFEVSGTRKKPWIGCKLGRLPSCAGPA